MLERWRAAPARPPRRILVLLTDAFGGHGGIAKFNRDLLSVLCEREETTRVVALPRLARDSVGRLPTKLDYRLEAVGGIPRYLAALAEATAGERFDWVICAHINLAPLAHVAALPSRAPITVIVHGIDAWQPSSRRLTNLAARRVDSFIAVSRFTKERFSSWTGLDQSKGHVLPNCVELAAFAPGPKPPRLIARYGLEQRKVLLTVARLAASERYKGVDEVLEVMPQLLRRVPDLAYLVVGDGDDRPRLERRSIELGLEGRALFVGAVAEEEKADHYRLADAFVMPSRGEGFGIVFLEAMACGIPAVGSAVDASREALRDGALGLLADPNDPEDVYARIIEALDRPRGVVPEGLRYFSREEFSNRLHALLELV